MCASSPPPSSACVPHSRPQSHAPRSCTEHRCCSSYLALALSCKAASCRCQLTSPEMSSVACLVNSRNLEFIGQFHNQHEHLLAEPHRLLASFPNINRPSMRWLPAQARRVPQRAGPCQEATAEVPRSFRLARSIPASMLPSFGAHGPSTDNMRRGVDLMTGGSRATWVG